MSSLLHTADSVHPRCNTIASTCFNADAVDNREQLCNTGETGPIERVSRAEAEITQLNAMLIDIDLCLLRPAIVDEHLQLGGPEAVYQNVISPWLERSPILRQAEVRFSGGGYHIIVWLSPTVQFHGEYERDRWSRYVRVVQCLLPSDPDCPGITALTRPIGSINSKNGVEVRQLKAGKPVSPEEIVEHIEVVRNAPFGVIAEQLLGSRRINPCPKCKAPNSRLDVLDRIGKCYGGCGRIKLEDLFDLYLSPREGARKEGV
ncbi:hypothetical protein KIH39_23255 [Telmatocola sphagniphila]|uniref:Uncharacterized protein n=1 Tax=Telmatocola sphagniphila TaxID=1123043 RepID=A0A8E6B5I5_9BACT|nr:hypothetical protein [Telmatocola sphagniphila]QVL31727.1 hypothetical protein KIH39_23255 [Telmatocola sphagniphila]